MDFGLEKLEISEVRFEPWILVGMDGTEGWSLVWRDGVEFGFEGR